MASASPRLNREHICPGDRICAAVSGGADSVALLLLLAEANAAPANGLGVGLSAVHVHHGLRGEEADRDQAFVQQLCQRLNVPLHQRHADVPAAHQADRDSPSRNRTVEEVARTLRYRVFDDLIAAGHAHAVLTAHTLDDQAETVLMKLLRGAWTEGIGGIHPRVALPGPDARTPFAAPRPLPNPAPAPASSAPSGIILRPLLGVRRADLHEYLRSRGQTWREDSSNRDPAFTRNRLRHALLPALREFNPAVDEALASLAELARAEEAHWQAELARLLPQTLLPGRPVRGGGRAVSASDSASVALEIERLRAMDLALRRRVVRAAARQLGLRLTFDQTDRLLAHAGLAHAPDPSQARPRLQRQPAAPVGGGRSSATRLQLSGGVLAERTPRELRLTRSGPPDPTP